MKSTFVVDWEKKVIDFGGCEDSKEENIVTLGDGWYGIKSGSSIRFPNLKALRTLDEIESNDWFLDDWLDSYRDKLFDRIHALENVFALAAYYNRYLYDLEKDAGWDFVTPYWSVCFDKCFYCNPNKGGFEPIFRSKRLFDLAYENNKDIFDRAYKP